MLCLMRSFKSCLSVLMLVVILFAAPSAHAARGALVTGKNLALLCNSQKSDDQFSCQSYIAGIIDYHNLIKSLGSAPSVDFCIPDAATMGDLKAVVTRYIMSHSEHQDFIAAPGVAMGLYNAFPCKKRK